MSLTTWRKEFYPTFAQDATSENAIEHSIRKWVGLRSENLQKHNVTTNGSSLHDGANSLWIDASTCALCVVYYDHSERTVSACSRCPLFRVRGNVACDKARPEEKPNREPYFLFTALRDPEPMIDWLKAAAELETKTTVDPDWDARPDHEARIPTEDQDEARRYERRG